MTPCIGNNEVEVPRRVSVDLTRDELSALLPECPGDNSALSRAHNQMRNKLANFDEADEMPHWIKINVAGGGAMSRRPERSNLSPPDGGASGKRNSQGEQSEL